jgi:hypothetical protein
VRRCIEGQVHRAAELDALAFAAERGQHGDDDQHRCDRRGQRVDERAASIHLRAAALTGYVLVTVLVAGFLVALARGAADLTTWSSLCAVGGLTSGVSLAVLHRRS